MNIKITLTNDELRTVENILKAAEDMYFEKAATKKSHRHTAALVHMGRVQLGDTWSDHLNPSCAILSIDYFGAVLQALKNHLYDTQDDSLAPLIEKFVGAHNTQKPDYKIPLEA